MNKDLEVVFTYPARDDVGAETADRFDWQSAMAAADGLSLYLNNLDDKGALPPDSDAFIVCELHEDWILVEGDSIELVSAKHRESRVGPWKTLNEIVTDGGLAHLFERWVALEMRPQLRLVTSVDLSSSLSSTLMKSLELAREQSNQKSLPKDEEHLLRRTVDEFVAKLVLNSSKLPEHWQPAKGGQNPSLEIEEIRREEVQQFFLKLRISPLILDRSVVDFAAPNMFASPILNRQGHPDALAAAIWEATHNLFRARMRDRGKLRNGKLPKVLEKGTEDGRSLRELISDSYEGRMVTLSDIELTVSVAVGNSKGFAPLPAPSYLSKLSMKMADGGCSDVSISRAEQLRVDYRRYRRDRRDNIPGSSAEESQIVRHLLRIADEKTDEVRNAGSKWGATFWRSLSSHLAITPTGLNGYGLDGDLVLGGICDLSSKCKVWFGENFDVESAIMREKAKRKKSP